MTLKWSRGTIVPVDLGVEDLIVFILEFLEFGSDVLREKVPRMKAHVGVVPRVNRWGSRLRTWLTWNRRGG